ncbi:MAG: hypothetical protein PF542_02840 [Nanoarchaeota archaeon]|jgi:hypothetical protein|nr:hypothetical protein [Nanoarchaeota archaeon]
MPTITLSVPAELKSQLEKNKIINWSEVARRAFNQQLKDLPELEKIKTKNQLLAKESMYPAYASEKSLAKD